MEEKLFEDLHHDMEVNLASAGYSCPFSMMIVLNLDTVRSRKLSEGLEVSARAYAIRSVLSLLRTRRHMARIHFVMSQALGAASLARHGCGILEKARCWSSHMVLGEKLGPSSLDEYQIPKFLLYQQLRSFEEHPSHSKNFAA